MTVSQITASAQAVIALANQIKAAKVISAEFSQYNGNNDPGWSDLTGAAVDGNGLIVGTNATPAQISNAIGSINVFLAYYNGQPVSTSPWGNNLEAISNPIV